MRFRFRAVLLTKAAASYMNFDGHRPHFVRFASPIFTIMDISNPSWSSARSIESLDLRGAASGRGTQDESEPLDFGFGLGTLPSRQESGRFVSNMDEPLNFGLSSLHVDQEDEYFAEDNDMSEYDFGLPLSDEGVDRGIFPPPSDIYNVGTGFLDFGIAQSPTVISNDSPIVTPTRTSEESIKSSFAERHYGHTGNAELAYAPPIQLARAASLTPLQYCTFPSWASVSSSFPALDQFNREHRNEELGISEPDGARPDDPISATTPLHTGSLPSSPHHRPQPDNSAHAATSGFEDPHKLPSDKELLELCQSMRFCALSEDEFHYARRLLSEVADCDSEREIAPPTLQDIVEAERPLHAAYLQATDTFRRRVQGLQRAVRLHTHEQQLRDQVQAMLDSVERRELLFQ